MLEGFAEFRGTVRDLTGIDLLCYKSTQLERRLQTLLRRENVPDLARYAKLLSASPERVQAFKDFLTINVTEWFRNPEKWKELRTAVLPALLRKSPRLRCWSAGCSLGCEPYSLAILLAEMDPKGSHEVIATDLDAKVLGTAAAGVYEEKDMVGLDPKLRAKYFSRTGDHYSVSHDLRARVQFKQHNLLVDPMPSSCDLILCRNVVIYFTDEAKDRLYRKFRASLKPGGVLFIGGTEIILHSEEIGLNSFSPFFYQAVT